MQAGGPNWAELTRNWSPCGSTKLPTSLRTCFDWNCRFLPIAHTCGALDGLPFSRGLSRKKMKKMEDEAGEHQRTRHLVVHLDIDYFFAQVLRH